MEQLEDWRGEKQRSREMLISIGLVLEQGAFLITYCPLYNLQHILKPTVLMQCQGGLGKFCGGEESFDQNLIIRERCSVSIGTVLWQGVLRGRH